MAVRPEQGSPAWTNRRLRAIEFFAGIGGFACAAGRVSSQAQLDVTAIDIDQSARSVYELNHAHEYVTAEIESLTTATLAEFAAELWWLSPPCQPYSRRGNQRDIDDPRAASLLHLIKQIELVRPRTLLLENVVGFADSRAFQLLKAVLDGCGYFVMQRHLCPTELGWPNRRPRFYLIASLAPLRAWDALPNFECAVADLIDGINIDLAECFVADDLVASFADGMDRVDPAQKNSVTACFGSSYGKSLLHAGSYYRHGATWRRFAPAEVARLLGFPRDYLLPNTMSYRRLWKLLGNSLSLPAVEYVLAQALREC